MKKFFSIIAMLVMALTASAAFQITKAEGWLESLYATFSFYDGAETYNVYVKGGQYSDYTKIDGQLVRSYGSYGRADAVGLKAGTYSIKVVPVVSGSEVTASAAESTGLVVKNYSRDGYAHYNATAGVGAYNNDGTLKSGARVIYVTKANAKTVELAMNVGKTEETRVGIQDIIQAYEKGEETRPLAIRIIGCLKYADMPTLGSSSIGLQVKGKGQNMNLTIEGIGDDATMHGYGVLVRACKYVELRNFAVMMHPEDGISFDTDNEHVWGHNLDIFYGENKGGDKAKGDGSFDVKGTFYCSVSANHFWDSGKCNLNSNGDEVDYVTYYGNWYDHSDSRHPRVRKSQHLHVYNNYFDGNSKYGVGSTTGSCIFVEKNYFRNCKYPMLISKQGSDINNGVGSSSDTKGTFSSEDGGIIKAFDNYMTGQKNFQPYNASDATNSIHFDAYLATSRNEPVPSTVVTLQGGTGYNNFDSASDFYSYTPLAAADVPANVTGQYGAGRMGHGDFTWTFNNATEDTNYDVITELSNALKNYSSKLVGIIGDETLNPGGGEGGDDPTPTPTPTDNASFCHFTGKTPSSTQVTVSGNYSDSKGSVTYAGTSYSVCVKMEGSTVVSVTPTYSGNVTLIFDAASKKLKVDDVQYTTDSNKKYTFAATAGQTYQITKGDSMNLFIIELPSAPSSVANISAENAEFKTVKYVKNGQLIIEKNGKQFNAAGAQVK